MRGEEVGAIRTLFAYNWAVRGDWLAWCGGVPDEELLRVRDGGQGGILRNLFHAIDVEYSWLCTIHSLPDFQDPFERHGTLEAVRALDARLRPDVRAMLDSALGDLDRAVPMRGDPDVTFSVAAILRHMLVHEVHHMGQISVWARQLGMAPVTADLLGRVT